MDPSASCTNCRQAEGRICAEHGGRDVRHDIEVMIHAKNQKGLRRVIVNFTPS